LYKFRFQWTHSINLHAKTSESHSRRFHDSKPIESKDHLPKCYHVTVDLNQLEICVEWSPMKRYQWTSP
jgi:hypothetical protein